MHRALAGGISSHIGSTYRIKLEDDFTALGAEVVAKLLMLSFSGVIVLP